MNERLKRIRQEILGVTSVFAGIFIGLSLATYSEWDSSLFVFTTLPTRNYGGIIGSYIADILISSVGLISYILPVVLFVYGIRRLLGRKFHKIYVLGLFLLMLSASILASLITATFHMDIVNKSGALSAWSFQTL